MNNTVDAKRLTVFFFQADTRRRTKADSLAVTMTGTTFRRMATLIETTFSPDEFLANYKTIRVRHDGREVTASVEVFEIKDGPNDSYFMGIGIRYKDPKPSLNIKKGLAVVPNDYVLTQQDFDRAIKNEVIAVP